MSLSKQIPRWRLLCVALWLAFGVWSTSVVAAAVEQRDSASAGERRAIPYKSESASAEADAVRVLITVGVLVALLIPVLYWLKKKHPMFGAAGEGGSKLNIVESRHVSPRLTLHLVDLKGEEILLAQSGDRVVQIAIGKQSGLLPMQSGDHSQA